jgi:NAD-dependent dihydropyrimidine dehydrogenase PreA subunit
MKQMPKKRKPSKHVSVSNSQLLLEKAEKEKKKRRDELLAQLGVKEFFVEGSITINKRTCKGVECKLCIEACPTNALFWKTGEVGIVKELCIYCGACVLSCIVNDCIKIERKRVTGEVERFSKPRDFTALQHGINVKKRRGKIQEVFPKVEDYLKQYSKKKHKRRENVSDN